MEAVFEQEVLRPLEPLPFAEKAQIRKNVLGRGGWLDRVPLGIVDYDQQVYLASYDAE